MSEIVMRQVDGITVLDITKSFMQISRTSEERPKLHQLVTESLDSGRNKIVLNMSQVVYCSNTAFGEVIAAFKTIRSRGGHLKLSNVPPSVRAQMELSHLLKLFDIYDDEAASIQSFKSTV
jgi:anti-anti-sigma factor